MSKIQELTINAHDNIYTGEKRTIPILVAIPENGVDENTNMLVLSYGYGARYDSNIFKKILTNFSDQYNLIITSGYYFGAKYMEEVDFGEPDSELIIKPDFLSSNYKEESKNEFNDMGVMQALDLLYAALGTLEYVGKKSHEINHIIGFGSSHGGYLCHLANIMCPNLFTYILDISGYIYPYYFDHIRKYVETRKLALLKIDWSYLVSNEKELQVDDKLRDLKYLYEHVDNNCSIIAFHGIEDWMVDYKEKQSFINSIGKYAELMLFEEKDIDHEWITNVDHGLGMNFLILFVMVLPMIIKKTARKKEIEKGKIDVGEGRLILDYASGYPVVEYIKMND